MIANMLDLCRNTNVMKNPEYIQGLLGCWWTYDCPVCGYHSFRVSASSNNAHCVKCDKSFDIFSFLHEILHFQREDAVRFIVGKIGETNEIDYRLFAGVVHHNLIKSPYYNGYAVFDCPEDRIPVSSCPCCGSRFFVYHIKGNTVTARCLYCAYYVDGIKKMKNVSKNKRSSQDKKWAEKVFEHYEGKCAFCESTDALNAHHIIPYSVDPELRTHINNGILLCKKHHNLAHIKV